MPRHKQTAVARNRLKRRLRELARLTLLPALADQARDVVVRALPAAYDADHAMLASEMSRIAERLGGSLG